MRARNLKPSFFVNEDLASIPPIGRLLFEGLWCLADRRGRLEDRPRRIKVSILPYEETEVDGLLNQLQASGFILRYEVGGKNFIQVINFEKHQYPHCKESESTIPAPDKNCTATIPAHLNPESPILNPESITLSAKPDSFDFEMVWGQYPRREGRKEAEKHFRASVKTEQDYLDIKNALQNYKANLRTDRTELKYTKTGATWFNNWRDWINYKGAVLSTVSVRTDPHPATPKPEDEEPTEEDRKEILAILAKAKAKRFPGDGQVRP